MWAWLHHITETPCLDRSTEAALKKGLLWLSLKITGFRPRSTRRSGLDTAGKPHLPRLGWPHRISSFDGLKSPRRVKEGWKVASTFLSTHDIIWTHPRGGKVTRGPGLAIAFFATAAAVSRRKTKWLIMEPLEMKHKPNSICRAGCRATRCTVVLSAARHTRLHAHAKTEKIHPDTSILFHKHAHLGNYIHPKNPWILKSWYFVACCGSLEMWGHSSIRASITPSIFVPMLMPTDPGGLRFLGLLWATERAWLNTFRLLIDFQAWLPGKDIGGDRALCWGR